MKGGHRQPVNASNFPTQPNEKEISMIRYITVLAAACALAAPVLATSVEPAAVERSVVAAADTSMTEGEIRKVDPSTKKITIKHGELKNIEMPAMTMVFQVKDPAMLERVKTGDKVRFQADKVNGAFTVMVIEVVK